MLFFEHACSPVIAFATWRGGKLPFVRFTNISPPLSLCHNQSNVSYPSYHHKLVMQRRNSHPHCLTAPFGASCRALKVLFSVRATRSHGGRRQHLSFLLPRCLSSAFLSPFPSVHQGNLRLLQPLRVTEDRNPHRTAGWTTDGLGRQWILGSSCVTRRQTQNRRQRTEDREGGRGRVRRRRRRKMGGGRGGGRVSIPE